jgi:hypothetical protein
LAFLAIISLEKIECLNKALSCERQEENLPPRCLQKKFSSRRADKTYVLYACKAEKNENMKGHGRE